MFESKGNKTKNSNIISLLARGNYRGNRGRNRVLIWAAAAGMLVLSAVFSIAVGKVEAEVLRAQRQGGTLATTYLERGSQQQYEQLQTLRYVKNVGKEFDIGPAYAGDKLCCDIKALDQTAWEQLTAPAYTDMHGAYPVDRGEIMLSRRALSELGITDPTVGMKIPLTIEHNLQNVIEEEFTLSGYFTDYTSTEREAVGYLSEIRTEELGEDWEQPDNILIQQNDMVGAQEVENKLYEDMEMVDSSQRFFGGNTYAYEAMEKFSGGYLVAISCGLLILISAFLLIQNVMSISMHKEMQQYGLLHTLGTTRKQQRQIYFRQTGRIMLWSVLFGGILSAVALGLVIPKILGNLYLDQAGGVGNPDLFHRGMSLFQRNQDLLYRGSDLFHPEVYFLSIGFMVLVLYIAAARTFRKAGKLSPLEAMHYIGEAGNLRANSKTPKTRKHTKHQIAHMAWKNLLRYPRRFALTIVSLVLGITVALCTAVIGRGLDQTNEINAKPDFVIENTVSPADNATWDAAGVEMDYCYHDEFSPVSTTLQEHILSISGIQKESVQTWTGGYLDVRDAGNGLFPWANAGGFTEKEFEEYKAVGLFAGPAVVQVADEAYLEKLADYVKENHLSIDMERLKSGDGVLLLHPHILSPELEQMASQVTGKPLDFTRLHTQEWMAARTEATRGMSLAESWNYGMEHEAEDNAAEDKRWAAAVTMELAGYADTKEEGFPTLVTEGSYEKQGTLYFLTGAEGFQKLGTAQKIFQMQFDVEKDQEEQVKLALQNLLAEENRALHIGAQDQGMVMTAKSDLLEEARSSIRTNQLIMGALSGVLIFMGILNYLNVMLTGMLSRQEEFRTLRNIGMTRKQLRNMLMLEGTYYVLTTGLLVLTIGSGILAVVAAYTKARVSYFQFIYPIGEELLILAVLAVVCAGSPAVLKKISPCDYSK
ncbi:MAG: ABC transporter permease [Lachnospiraceae bacterium]|nr:ABC transporter permease [Lachnospiraceae bacterium]